MLRLATIDDELSAAEADTNQEDRERNLRARTRVADMLLRSPRTWIWAAIAGALAAAGAAAVSLPLPVVVLLSGLGFATGAVGYIDQKTELIPNRNTLLLGVFGLIGVAAIQAETWPNPVLAVAIGTSIGSFIIMIILVLLTGFASGGDIKLVPVIAGVLSVVSPLTGPLWLLIAFILCIAATVVARVRSTGPVTAVPMAPLMAAAIPLSLVASAFFYTIAHVHFPLV